MKVRFLKPCAGPEGAFRLGQVADIDQKEALLLQSVQAVELLEEVVETAVIEPAVETATTRRRKK